MRGFSPVPGFRFDVELAERDAGLFVVTFSQGDRGTPYLEGDAVWFVSDGSEGGHGSQIEEEINISGRLLRARSLAEDRFRPYQRCRPQHLPDRGRAHTLEHERLHQRRPAGMTANLVV